MTHRAGSVAALGVDETFAAGGAPCGARGAARAEAVLVVEGGAVDLTGQAGLALDLALARVSDAAFGAVTDAITVAAVPVATLG
jgi:hypothetical protein